MKVCPYCFQRYPLPWTQVCHDDQEELVSWSPNFDRMMGIRRAQMNSIDPDVSQLVWLNPLMKNVDSCPIVIDQYVWPTKMDPLFLLLPKGYDQSRLLAPKKGTKADKRQALLLAISRNILRCIDLIDNYFPNTKPTESLKTVAKIFDGKSAALYKGGVGPEATPVTTERRLFLTAFADAIRSATFPVGAGCHNSHIKLEKLLGKTVKKLFRPAIDEECKSARYREAVIIDGTKTYAEMAAELDWTKAKHMVVGGSSGAGKTYSAKLILRAVNKVAQYEKYLKRKTKPVVPDVLYVEVPTGVKLSPKARMQYVVSIDGGDARARSQIRSIVLQAALALGYTGVSDMHSNTGKMDFKSCIKEAARLAKVHVVEPRTFTSGSESYSSIVLDPKRTILAMVHADKDVIAKQGKSRAWYDFGKEENKERPLLPIDPNKAEIGCESKAYSAGTFGVSRKAGSFFSRKVLTRYISKCSKSGKPPLAVEVISGGKVLNGKVNYEDATKVWVYFDKIKTKSGMRGYRISNPLKFENEEKILKSAEMVKRIVMKDEEKKPQFRDRWWKIAVFAGGTRYCVIIPGAPKKK